MRFERLERQHVEECTYGYILTFQEEQWSYERAHMRLSDFVAAPRFIGYVAYDNDHFVGAAFCHEVVGALDNKLVIDEFFIVPAYQRLSHGSELLDVIHRYAASNHLRTTTLVTEAEDAKLDFYIQSGFTVGENHAFLRKDVSDNPALFSEHQ